MRVLVDMTFVSEDSLYLSLPRVAMRFLYGISTSDLKNYCLLFESSAAEGMHRLLPEFDFLSVDLYRNRTSRIDLRYFLLPFKYRKIVNNSGCDVLYIPGEGWYATILKFKIPSVVTVNDIKQYKKDFDQHNAQRGLINRISAFVRKMFFQKNLYKADRVITISEYTRQDIIKYFPKANQDKIHAVHCTVAPIQFSQKPAKLIDEPGYILNVNSIHQFKNPMTLIRAYERIKDKVTYNLVLVGRKTNYWEEHVYPYIREHNLGTRVIRLENLEDSELRYLYEHAELFVTPSLHEGFGYTPIEAAIYGSPVVSSRCESLPEATMELVKYYEPATDEYALMKAMSEVLASPPSVEQRNKISSTFLNRYTARNHATELLKLFSLLEQ